MIYFDSAASYPLLDEVKLELINSLEQLYANPSSIHEPGEEAAQKVELARETIAEAIGALPSEIIFTSGATESNNFALKGHFSLPAFKQRRHLVISSIEHKCVHSISDFLKRTASIDVSVVQPNEDGLITPEALLLVIREDTSLVSIMHLNNELGTINPIKELGNLCLSKNIRLHTDAAQSFMKVNINVDDMNIDYLSLSGHKIGALKGIGAAYIRDRRDLAFEPLIHGAGQEDGLRGGTLPAPLIQSFGTAVTVFPEVYSDLAKRGLKRYLLAQLSDLNIPFFANGDSIDSIVSLTLPNTRVPQLIRETFNEFALATGSACSSKEIEASHVLTAIGLDRALAANTLRLSFHHKMTHSDIDHLVTRIRQLSAS